MSPNVTGLMVSENLPLYISFENKRSDTAELPMTFQEESCLFQPRDASAFSGCMSGLWLLHRTPSAGKSVVRWSVATLHELSCFVYIRTNVAKDEGMANCTSVT